MLNGEGPWKTEKSVFHISSLAFADSCVTSSNPPQPQRITGILNKSRDQHTQAVQSRIDSVEQQKDVSTHTAALFALAKETAQNEATAFELKQRVDVASEVKAVLDSWVRYEGQQREEEQRQLARTVIEKVTASLRDEKTQRQILDDAVADIENLVKSKAI